MKCSKHPTYRAIQKPRGACAACWYLYFRIFPNRPVGVTYMKRYRA